ncbi:MAG: DUF6261 family protein [Dysgonamonadaceae bacterium]|nr:DUF6261 family protein [Dysgonamonadaceae bacterium]
MLTFTSNLEAEMPQTYTEKLEELQTAFNNYLTDAVAALTNDNQTFENEQLSRKEYLSTYVTGVLKNARADVQAQFIDFVDVVNALAIAEGAEKYAALKQKINTYVRHYVAQARLRIKKRDETS